MRNPPPSGQPVLYECPKRLRTGAGETRITIERHDIHRLYPSDVSNEPWIWSTLMWGSSRDRTLIRRLRAYTSLEQLKQEGIVKTREGVNRGNRQKYQPALVGRHWYSASDFPAGDGLYLDAVTLPVNKDACTHTRDSVDLGAFQAPQLLLKSSWLQSKERFQGRLVRTDGSSDGVICSQSYVSLHTTPEHEWLLHAACLLYNSAVATYFLLLTSGRFACDRSEPLTTELRSVPLPSTPDPNVRGEDALNALPASPEVDAAAYTLLKLNEAETILIEDLVRYTLPDYKGVPTKARGRYATIRAVRGAEGPIEPDLTAYADV